MAQTKYKPIRRIGIGGMAEVLLASQQGLGGFEKLVVIKRILSHLREDNEFTQMFLDEARLAASLHHPNIVQIFDIYRDEQEFFVAMEYISGEDMRYLSGKARKGELEVPIPLACRIFADLAEGLEHAHNAVDVEGNPLQIVHRDVAPGNAIVGYSGLTKLLDFGVAKATVSHVYTRPGTLKGKLAYMSPEQVRQESVDQRSDLFSLGILAWELLTGRRLFRGANQAAILQAIMALQPAPPSKHNPDVPAELDALVMLALQKDLRKRLSSAGEMRDRLEAVMRSSGEAASHRDVGQWICSALSKRQEQRREMERAVTLEARELVAPSVTDDEMLPMMIATSSPGGDAFSLESSATGASALTGGSHVGSYHTQRSYPSYEPQRRSRGLLFALLGGLVVLLIVGLVGAAFLLGRGTRATTEPAAVPSQTVDKPVSLVVHVNPPEAKLWIDGETQAQPVGEDGMLVGVASSSNVRVRATKSGYEPFETTVRTPTEGTAHVHLNLKKTVAAVAPATATATAPEPPVAQKVEPPDEAPEPVSRTPRRHRVVSRRERRPSRRLPPAARPTAVLLISYAPDDARLEVDGERRPGTSPARIEDLEDGTHTIVVRADGYRTISKEVRLRPGQQARPGFGARAKRGHVRHRHGAQRRTSED
jgi:serine/threonine protein kinase